jgi:hypothetical protein
LGATAAFGLTCDTALAGGAEPESWLQAAIAAVTQSSRTLMRIVIFSPAIFVSLPNMPLITTGAADRNGRRAVRASQLQRRLEHRRQLV